MRKLIIALTLLWILLFVTWTTFVVPHFTKLPQGYSYSADIDSQDNFYDENLKQYQGNVPSKTKFYYQFLTEKQGVYEIKNVFDVRNVNDKKIFSVTRIYGVNPITGEHVSMFGDKNRTGYLFSPKNAKKEPYTYWHINYDAPATMIFQKEEELFGLPVYRYEAKYTADQTKELMQISEVGKTRGITLDIHLVTWIEPVSGHMVKYQDKTTAYYYDLATKEKISPWNQFTNTYTEESVKSHVAAAQYEKTKYLLLSRDIPGVLLIFGIVILFIFILRRNSVPKQFTNMTVSPLVVAYVTLFCSILVLVGWFFDITLFTKIYPSFTGMNPMTAVAFIFLGISVFFWNKQIAKEVVICCASVICIIGVVRLSSIYFGFPFQIDLLLFREKLIGIDGSSSRISPITAINFLFFGAALLTSYLPAARRYRIPVGLSVFVAALGTVGIFAYAFSGFDLLAMPVFLSFAFLTGILFALNGLFFAISASKNTVERIHLRKVIHLSTLFLAFIIPFALTIAAYNFLEHAIYQKQQTRFDGETTMIENTILKRIEIYKNVLEGGRGLFAASDDVTRGEWKNYVESLNVTQNYPGIQGIGFAKVVTQKEKSSHEQNIRNEGFQSYAIKPDGNREAYTPIIYLEPFKDRNLRAFGYDMFSESIRRTAMMQARDTGSPSLSGKVTLVQETDTDIQAGFLLYVPVYKTSSLPDSVEERQRTLIGYVYSPFRMNDLMQNVLEDRNVAVSFAVYDATQEQSEKTLLYTTENTVISETQSGFTKNRRVYVAGHPWTIQYSAPTTFGKDELESITPQLILWGGFVFSGVFFAFVYSLVTSRARAVAYAKRLTQTLQSSKSQLLEAQRIAEIGSWEWDIVKNTVTWSDELYRIFGVRPNSIVLTYDSYLKRIFSQDQLHTKEVIERALRTHKSFAFDHRIALQDGTIRWIHGKGQVITDDVGKPIKMSGTAQDVTREKEIDKAKSEFISIASHQLRTPLGITRWYLEALQNDPYITKAPKQTKIYFKELLNSNNRILKLVSELLAISKIDDAHKEKEVQAVQIESIIRETTHAMQALAKKRDIKLRLTLPKTQLPLLVVEPFKCREVLENLITNALMYSRKGGEVKITVSCTNSHIQLSFKDDGIGIEPSEQKKIFTKFYRTRRAVIHNPDGSGLGLYLVKAYVTSWGGKINVESEKENGTTFIVQLPISKRNAV